MSTARARRRPAGGSGVSGTTWKMPHLRGTAAGSQVLCGRMEGWRSLSLLPGGVEATRCLICYSRTRVTQTSFSWSGLIGVTTPKTTKPRRGGKSAKSLSIVRKQEQGDQKEEKRSESLGQNHARSLKLEENRLFKTFGSPCQRVLATQKHTLRHDMKNSAALIPLHREYTCKDLTCKWRRSWSRDEFFSMRSVK